MLARFSFSRDQRGQVLVIVAGGFIGLAAIAALVLEGGTIMLNRRDAQNASDLAAVAGTRIVALNYTSGTPRDRAAVYDAVEASVGDNGCAGAAGTPCSWEAEFVGAGLVDLGSVRPRQPGVGLPGGTLGVKVAVTRQPGALFGRVLGFNSWNVSTEGTALAAKPSQYPAGAMLPIALCGWFDPANANVCAQASTSPAPGNFIDFQAGQIYDLTDGKDAPGGFGWLSWDGSNSAGALANAICTPSNTAFSLDSPYDSPGSYGGYIGTNPATGETWFPIDPGKSNKNTVRSCLDGWIASGATVLIPIYDLVTGNGNNAAYHITGVAAFVLTSREQPAVDNIQGYFVDYYPYADVPGGLGTQPPGPGDISTFIGLVK